MWKTLEERNLAIIETVMNELGVSDIEELPAKVVELKASAQQGVYPNLLPPCDCGDKRPLPKVSNT